MKLAVAFGNKDDLEHLRALMQERIIRPMIARRFPLERIAEAHTEAETTRAPGTIMVTV